MVSNNMTWRLLDHLCKSCGGRLLQCASGQGPSPGGNPLFKCADCGNATTSLGPEALCWCGFSHRLQSTSSTAYKCVPFSLIKDRPEFAQKLINAFRSCGCEPGRGEVGIMLEDDYRAVCTLLTTPGSQS